MPQWLKTFWKGFRCKHEYMCFRNAHLSYIKGGAREHIDVIAKRYKVCKYCGKKVVIF